MPVERKCCKNCILLKGPEAKTITDPIKCYVHKKQKFNGDDVCEEHAFYGEDHDLRHVDYVENNIKSCGEMIKHKELRIFPCTCGGEVLVIEPDDEFEEVNFAMWQYGSYGMGFWNRLRHAWSMLRNKPYVDQLCFTNKQIRFIGERLIELSDRELKLEKDKFNDESNEVSSLMPKID